VGVRDIPCTSSRQLPSFRTLQNLLCARPIGGLLLSTLIDQHSVRASSSLAGALRTNLHSRHSCVACPGRTFASRGWRIYFHVLGGALGIGALVDIPTTRRHPKGLRREGTEQRENDDNGRYSASD
jgi:hypothetical protein